jgi:Domain of unknown function (DUF4845)
MHNMKQPDGMSFLSVFFGILITGLVVLLIFKIGPPYLEHYGVVSSLKSLEQEAGMSQKSNTELLTLLQKRLEINDVRGVNSKDVTIKKQARHTTMRVAYEVQVPLISNINLLITFDNTALLR